MTKLQAIASPRHFAAIFLPRGLSTQGQRRPARTSAASAPHGTCHRCFGSWANDPKIYAAAKAAGKLNELPVNHSPKFAPVLHPTMQTGVEALVVGALAWLGVS